MHCFKGSNFFMPILKIEQIDQLQGLNVLVVGDLILDHYIRGFTERTSPEAPVPVVVYEAEDYVPGGAANVARNLAAVGARATCIGVVGADENSNTLCSRMGDAGVNCSGMVRLSGRITTTKTRIVSQGQQVVRVDREGPRTLDADATAMLCELVDKSGDKCDAILISDYAKGVVSDEVLAAILRRGARDRVPVIVDPKGRDYRRYRGVYALTPNAKEAYEATGIATSDADGLARAAAVLFEQVDCQVLVITRGAHGVALFEKGQEPRFLQTRAREVFDVTGAGDTFAAFLALGCAAGLGAEGAAELANIAAGVVVSKIGAAVVTPAELRGAMLPGRAAAKLRQAGDLARLGADLRARGRRVVFTNGCFDFLHAGHVAFLQQARELGDVLVLATNTDPMIRRLKGEGRPVISEEQRLGLLGAIEAVDYLVVFGDETPHAVIRALRPDVLVKGSNYRHDEVEGYEIVESYGGTVRLLEVLPSIVTHELLEKRKT
jgi:D-beta-D-heptose 7-phosphate kinase/D-beta-D-heptose 1-phosphate adenosyltransferase